MTENLKNPTPRLERKSNSFTLKEEILYRKFRNDMQVKTRFRSSLRKQPAGGMQVREVGLCQGNSRPETSNDSSMVDIRLRLLQNRRELDQLLQNVPNLLKQHAEKNSTKVTDLQRPISSLTSNYLNQRNENLHLNADVLSCKILNPPMDDSSLSSLVQNGDESLQDSDEPDQHCQNHKDFYKRKDRLFSEEQSLETLPRALQRSFFYKVAKPKPLPRSREGNKTDTSNKHSTCDVKQSPCNNTEEKTRLESDTQKSSDTTEILPLAIDTQSGFVKVDFEVTLKDKSQNDHSNYLTITNIDQPETNTTDDINISQVPAKSDSSSNTNSSGYYSLRSGSTSLSSSNSNASSTNSTKLPLAPSNDNLICSIKTTRDRSREAKSDELSSNTEVCNVTTNEDDDVFPVKSCIDPAEYAIITKQESIKTENVHTGTNSFSVKALNKDLDKISSSTTKIKTTSSRNPSKRRYHEPRIVNSISMVEQSPQLESRSRINIFPSSIKLRMNKSNSSRNDALRNSRAFALKLKELNEETSNRPGCISSESKKKFNYGMPRKSKIEESAHNDNSLKAQFLKKSAKSIELRDARKELSASLNHLDRVLVFEKQYNTLSGASGRHLSRHSTFFQDQESSKSNRNNVMFENTRGGSTWSINFHSEAMLANDSIPRPSMKNRIKSAFSLQNLQKAISMEKLSDSQRNKSQSNSYLNEFDEDISQLANSRGSTSSNKDVTKSRSINKAPSISSIFSTVRMRKRKSRERRAAKARHTIAIDSHLTENLKSNSNQVQFAEESTEDNIDSSDNFRPIGRVLQMNVKEQTLVVEMKKPSSGPFDFYISRRKETGSVYISSLSDRYPINMYAGLMKLGDEITQVNGVKVDSLTLDQIYDIIFQSKKLILHIKPSQIHVV